VKQSLAFASSLGRRAALLAALSLVNIACSAFFLSDVIEDYETLTSGDGLHLAIEAVAAVALLTSTLFLLLELRTLWQRNTKIEAVVKVARGEMASVIESFFDAWELTAAEREVALLLLKGFDNEAIATMRGRAAGTIRAQCASIYAKAEVDGRSQLMSVFVEELLHEPLAAPV
jgi:DNA-binding NarL/FixJ family response regulator